MTLRTPVLLQAEAEECGLVCLAMIAAHHGCGATLSTLRNRFARFGSAPRLQALLAAADNLALDTRALRVRLGELRQLSLPALLHWQFDHFVVLTRVRRRHCVIHDPAAGRRRLRDGEMRRAFTGVAVEFTPRREFVRCNDAARWRLRDFTAAFGGWGRFAAGMLALLLATQLLALSLPIATQLLIDEVVVGRQQRWLGRFLAGTGCLLLAAVVLEALRRRLALAAALRFSLSSSAAIVRHLFDLPVARVSRRAAGDLIARIDSLQPIQRALSETLLNAVVHATTVTVTMAAMLLYSRQLAAVSLAMAVAVLIVQLTVLPRSREHQLETLVAGAAAKQSLIESLRAFASVRLCGYERSRLAHWCTAFERAAAARARQGRLAIAAVTANGVVATVEQLLFLYLGISAVVAKQLTLGALFALFALRGRLTSAMQTLAADAAVLYLSRAHAERVGEILSIEREPDAADAACRDAVRGRIECERVCFAYDDRLVLNDFNCTIDSGEHVVVCGPSGSGKSTLLKLIATELEALEGRVRVDGYDVRLWDRRRLRSQIGIVRQGDALMGGSIADNVSGFESLPDAARLRRALRIADVWADVETLPLKLQTPLTGRDSRLSGGQLQRLLIARAVYREPRILLLDEATSQLDGRTEARVIDNLAALSATIISVAHRSSAIARAGRRIDLLPAARGICRPTLP
ncbi:MAG: peptidase domain-containing ABC transporter [Woeseiaceae bacterium]|nr:peptidase domain-containing ABC transporter [Woeseiaceae bacterium]